MKLNKKGGIKEIVLGIIIFSLFIYGGVFLLVDINTNYDANIDTSDFKNTFNAINETYDLSESMKNESFGTDITEANSIDDLVAGSFRAIRQTSTTFGIIGAAINDFAAIIGLPASLIKFALTALTLVFVFAIIAFVRGIINP